MGFGILFKAIGLQDYLKESREVFERGRVSLTNV